VLNGSAHRSPRYRQVASGFSRNPVVSASSIGTIQSFSANSAVEVTSRL
jgi:hypothetical protein